MLCVKWESGAEICRGCLSTDRKLSSLANYDLFFTLLNDSQKLEVLKSPALRLCWECNALLRRVQLFRAQVQHAHRRLEELGDELPIKGLSQLSACHKEDYDVVIEEVFDCIEEQIIIPIKEEKAQFQTDAFNQNLNQDENLDFEDGNHSEAYIQLDLELETTDNSLKETNKTPLRKSKRKLKIVSNHPLPTKIKIKNLITDTHRKGLRSSGEIIPPLYPLNKNNANKKDISKKKIKTNSSVKGEFKQPKRKGHLNCKDLSQAKKENKTPDVSINTAKELQNEVTNDDKAEANTDSELENVEKDKPEKKPKGEIEIDNTEQNNHSNEDYSETKNINKDDPNFEEELRKDPNERVKIKKKRVATEDDPDYEEELRKDPSERIKIKKKKAATKDDPNFEEELGEDPNEKVKIKKKGVCTRDKCLHCVCIRFDIIDELDKYFTKVDLSPEEVGDILNNELSYKNEEQPYGCKYCGLCFQLHRTLLKHMRNSHKQIAKCTNPVYLMYRCNICHKTIRKDHTEAHMKYLHRWRYYCRECDKNFWDLAEGKSHYMEAHREAKGNSCGICKTVTVTKRAMESHMRERHNLMPCDICGKSLHGVKNLRLHVRLRHQPDGSQPEQRYCVPCDKNFPSVYAYEFHLRYSTIHTGQEQERVPCTECGKLLRDKRSLNHHYDRFHSDKTKFQCPHCGKYYSFKSGLTQHINSVHLKLKLPKDKLCTICGRGFTLNRTLIHHMRTHTGERPHACPHCPAAFAQPYPLQKHLATQHPGHKREAPVAQE